MHRHQKLMSINTLKHMAALIIGLALSGAGNLWAAPVRAIDVTGNKRIETETILSYIPLKTGETYDAELLDQSLKELDATGYFSHVQLKDAQGHITIEVIENGIINRVAFEGNSAIKDDKLTEELQIRTREVLSKPKTQAARQRILDLYRRMGRYNATVEPKVILLEDNRMNLIFEINEGDVTYVRRINFIGNHHISSKTLEKILLTKRTQWYRFFASDDTYDPDRFIADQQVLRQHYYDHGFPDFRIISAVAELSPDQKDLFLTFTVEEGDKHTIGKTEIRSEITKVTPDSLRKHIILKEGHAYSEKTLDQTVLDMTEAIGETGYAFADVDFDLVRNRTEHTIDVHFNVRESARVYVERIEIRGNDRTRDEVIRREIRIQEGDAYNQTFLKEAERNLYNLGYFSRVSFETEQGSAPDKARIIIQVEERSTGEFGVAIGFSNLDKGLGKIHFVERNFMGTGRTVSTEFSIAKRRQDFDIHLVDPYFLGYDLQAGIDLFHYRSTRIRAYRERSSGISPNLAYNLSENLVHKIIYTLRHDHVDDVPVSASRVLREEKGSFLSSSIANIFMYDRRNSLRSPTKGYTLTATNILYGLGGDTRHMHNSLGAAIYYSPLSEVTLSARGSVGHIMDLGKKIRVVDAVLLGYDTFRGFSYGGVGPRDVHTKDPLGGTKYWRGSVEALFPIGLPNEFGVKGAVFSDFGSLWHATKRARNLVKVHDKRSIRMSIGAGIAWDSPFGPIRIDYAIPIRKEKFDEESRWLIGASTPL